jgi:serine/alanine adding enzyme
MRIEITSMQEADTVAWDRFVHDCGHGNPYQLSACRSAILRGYSHNAYYLIARASSAGHGTNEKRNKNLITASSNAMITDSVVGVLPLIHIQHRMFGNSLVSMPYFDAGGVVAEDRITERRLIENALRLADERDIPIVELRQYRPLSCVIEQGLTREALRSAQREAIDIPGWIVSMTAAGNKVRMLLELPQNPDELMQSFDAKLRSQIRKSKKNGLTAICGGVELLDDFYSVFAVNMRDLGSPVHSKQFIRQILLNNPESTRVFIVYGQNVPIACGLTLGFNNILSNPWASSIRRYSRLSPNMLLYWSMLEYACQNKYRAFDFGRSTVGEGTYRFKEQWGAKPTPLYWYRFAHDNNFVSGIDQNKGRMHRVMEIWKRLPVPVTRILGPMIRRYISL